MDPETKDTRLPEPPPTLALANLDLDHLAPFERAVSAILASPAAENAFAQLIDGHPSRLSFERSTRHQPARREVVDRDQPSAESVTLFREFRALLQVRSMEVESTAIQALQNAPVSSHEFYLCLLHVTVLVVHMVGALVFKSTHPIADLNPQDNDIWMAFPHFVVDFYLWEYFQYPFYPYGLLDSIGYWTESEIFGGVVLFDQTESNNRHVYIHTAEREAFRLADPQYKLVRQLCESDATDVGAFLPLHPAPHAEILRNDDLADRSIWGDGFSRVWHSNALVRSCVRLLTDSDREMIEWARERRRDREDEIRRVE